VPTRLLSCLAMGVALVAGPGSPSPAPSAPPTVVAQWSSPATGKQPVIEVLSGTTGKLLHELVKLPGPPSSVSGPFPGPNGNLWYSVSAGPEYRCPKVCIEAPVVPGTCTSRVVRFDPATGTTQTVLELPSSEAVQGAVPSPNGSEVAYLAESCTGYADWHYVVTDLATGRSSQIGLGSTPCHSAYLPTWSADGTELAFAWGPSVLHRGATDPNGLAGNACPQWHNGELAVVPAHRTGPVTAAELHSAGAGCSYVAAAFDVSGILAVRDCGDLGDWLGRPSLVQLNSSFVPGLRLNLPARPDGLTLSVDAAGRNVLIDEYQAPLPGSAADIPTQWLIAFDGHALRTIVRDASGVDSIDFGIWGQGGS
jgi:hypothetical protein